MTPQMLALVDQEKASVRDFVDRINPRALEYLQHQTPKMAISVVLQDLLLQAREDMLRDNDRVIALFARLLAWDDCINGR